MEHYGVYTVYTTLRLAPSDGVQASGFADRGVGQPDDLEDGQPPGYVDFDPDGPGGDAVDGE